MHSNHHTNHNTTDLRVMLDATVDRAMTRLTVATQHMSWQQRDTLARLLNVLGARLADRDGDGAVTVIKAIGHSCGAEAGASVLRYCLAVGTRNALTGGAR